MIDSRVMDQKCSQGTSELSQEKGTEKCNHRECLTPKIDFHSGRTRKSTTIFLNLTTTICRSKRNSRCFKTTLDCYQIFILTFIINLQGPRQEAHHSTGEHTEMTNTCTTGKMTRTIIVKASLHQDLDSCNFTVLFRAMCCCKFWD